MAKTFSRSKEYLCGMMTIGNHGRTFRRGLLRQNTRIYPIDDLNAKLCHQRSPYNAFSHNTESGLGYHFTARGGGATSFGYFHRSAFHFFTSSGFFVAV